MNIGNITSDNFNLDGNGKDIQIEVYEQLIEQLQQENQELKLELSGYRQAILEDKDMLGLKEESKISFRKCLNILDKKETQDIWYIKILQKYKSIIGVSDEKEN